LPSPYPLPQAGEGKKRRRWVPAFAGMTKLGSRRLAHPSCSSVLLSPSCFCAPCFCGRDCRALALPGSLSAAASRLRKSRAAIAGRMPASSTSAHGRAVGEPRCLLAKSRGHGCPRDRGREGAFFFGYFLLGKQKKVTGRQEGGRNTHGRESVLAKRRKSKQMARAKWIPAFAGMTRVKEAFAGMTARRGMDSRFRGNDGEGLDPGLRRDDERGGFRWNDGEGLDSGLRGNDERGALRRNDAERMDSRFRGNDEG
jgi:hypothetical protein